MTRKAQEEMVGFILIVVLVAIAGVVFLGISLRGGEENRDNSNKIYSLLGGLSQITTACEIPDTNLKSVRELIRECSEGKICDVCEGSTCGSSSSACEVLENTLKEAMVSSYAVTDKSYAKYYNLTLYYAFDNKELIKPILAGPQGNCNGQKLFNNRPFGSEGDRVIMSLEVCFRS